METLIPVFISIVIGLSFWISSIPKEDIKMFFTFSQRKQSNDETF